MLTNPFVDINAENIFHEVQASKPLQVPYDIQGILSKKPITTIGHASYHNL